MAMATAILKSEIIEKLVNRFPQKTTNEIASAANELLDHMIFCLGQGERIEIRGFGTFNHRRVDGRFGRNPKTGEVVTVPPKTKILFKCSKTILVKLNQ